MGGDNRVIVRDYGQGHSQRWYVVAVHYPSALQAKRAWERVEHKIHHEAGDQGIGVLRMAPDPEVLAGRRPYTESGAPLDAHGVIAVGMHEPTVKKAERLLRDGTPWTPTENFIDAVVARRAHVVTGYAGQGRGRLVIRRPTGRGAALDPTGEMHEPEPGKG